MKMKSAGVEISMSKALSNRWRLTEASYACLPIYNPGSLAECPRRCRRAAEPAGQQWRCRGAHVLKELVLLQLCHECQAPDAGGGPQSMRVHGGQTFPVKAGSLHEAEEGSSSRAVSCCNRGLASHSGVTLSRIERFQSRFDHVLFHLGIVELVCGVLK